MKNICALIVTLLLTQIAGAQDIHWSQFNDNPIFQNPGNTGNFNGDIRFVGNFRDQWRAVSVPYQTISVSADGKLYNYRNLGIGGMFFHDVTGDGRLRTIELQANVAYLLKLTKDSTHTITPGINLGMNHRQVNWNAFQFGNQYNGQYYDANLPTNELYQSDRKTNFSVGVGAVYRYLIGKRKTLEAGVGVFNLNRPNQGFFNEKIHRDIRTSVFAKFYYPIGLDWDIIPSFQFSFQGKYREFIVGSSVKYTIVNRLAKYAAVYGGIWYRAVDAAYLTVGMDYQQWFVGLSYDMNLSTLTKASRVRGGFEVAVRYILFRFKPKKIVHRICPDYI
ncbi:MAG TPA: PorP/SprF family type IX secretion system membrane protein [Taishania sp.]|nr:PorP/SprF family type IX secretion system membrane protein [Taishania sp.]